jgi:PAS domain-containing protein
MSIEKLSDLIAEAEDMIHMALSSAEIGIWYWNPTTDNLVWNAEMFKLFGVSRDAFEDNVNSFMRCLVESDKPKVKAALDRSIDTGEIYDVVYELVTVPNRKIRGRGKCYKDKSGKPVKFVGVCIEYIGDRT